MRGPQFINLIRAVLGKPAIPGTEKASPPKLYSHEFVEFGTWLAEPADFVTPLAQRHLFRRLGNRSLVER